MLNLEPQREIAVPQLIELVSDYYPSIISGRWDWLIEAFEHEPKVNTPLRGAVAGRSAFRNYLTDEQQWLRLHLAEPVAFALTCGEGRMVSELTLCLQKDGQAIYLPVAMVVDHGADLISDIRIYHSTWPLSGSHQVRPPMLDPQEGLEEPEVIQRYMQGLAKPDIEAVLAVFEEDGYAREPSGADFKHQGPEARKAFYQAILGQGGIPLQHCTATFDGTRFAVEYVLDWWGATSIPLQAGIAVYEIAPSGLLQAARIYDDISPPGE